MLLLPCLIGIRSIEGTAAFVRCQASDHIWRRGGRTWPLVKWPPKICIHSWLGGRLLHPSPWMQTKMQNGPPKFASIHVLGGDICIRPPCLQLVLESVEVFAAGFRLGLSTESDLERERERERWQRQDGQMRVVLCSSYLSFSFENKQVIRSDHTITALMKLASASSCWHHHVPRSEKRLFAGTAKLT